MKRQHMMWYVAALIAGVVTALAFGAPASTVLLALVVLACPLMMMFMMGNMHGGGPRSGTGQEGSHPTRSDSI
jgi:hypothetical protein